MLHRLLPALVLAAVVLGPSGARADDMDVTLQRLRIMAPDAMCPGPAGQYCGDEELWQQIMSQLGMSMASPALTPARTLGYRKFYIGFETWMTGIDDSALYWERGTEGDGMDLASNRFVNSNLVWSRLAARKGFPFGFELGTSIGHAYSTSYWVLGVSLQLAPFEGFREGAGWLPDFAVRGTVHTMAGDHDFSLTVPSLDFIISKPLVIAHTVTLTPIVSAQLVWILADSEVIDLTPERSAFRECRPDPSPLDPTATYPPGTGTLMCAGEPQDFESNWVFDEVRDMRVRLAFGAQLRYQQFTASGSFQFDMSEPQTSFGGGRTATVDRQWTFAFGVGMTY